MRRVGRSVRQGKMSVQRGEGREVRGGKRVWNVRRRVRV